MSTALGDLVTQLRQLSRNDQQEVVRFLLAELDGERDPNWEDAWSEELDRRRAAEAAGDNTSVPWEQAKADLRKRFP
jgi:putative addiction module component (TIGR02574 family)